MFEGKRDAGPAGPYDGLIVLAERYHWTPEQIGRMDPDFVEELAIRLRAEVEAAEAERKRQKRKRKRRGGRGEDADLSEIV